MEEKITPQDILAEQSLLGSMMISKEAIAEVASRIRPEYFYASKHSHIFFALISLYKKNEPIDLITVSNELKKQKTLDKSGGRVYLAEVIDSVPTASNILKYADIVLEKAILRKLIETSSDILQKSYDDSEEVSNVLEFSQKSILEISKEVIQDDFVKLDSILMPLLDDIHNVYGEKILGITTGYQDLDAMTSGYQPSDLVILAARPSMGKTALAINFAMNAARENHAVAIFSLEMPKEQIALRMLCSESRISSSRVRTGNMIEGEFKDINSALGRLGEMKIYIDDKPGISPLELRAKTRKLLTTEDIKLIIIDYLQLMKSGKSRVESRFQEVSEIVREVKAFAREVKIPIIALSQLSRDVERRQDRRPQLSDLRESGEIEQTADLVMFIHRDDYYEATKEDTAETSVIISKQRNGPTGDISLMFRKDIGRFYNSEKKAAAEYG